MTLVPGTNTRFDDIKTPSTSVAWFQAHPSYDWQGQWVVIWCGGLWHERHAMNSTRSPFPRSRFDDYFQEEIGVGYPLKACV
jgi:hypothetical protein